ncbi:serine hydrolase FSH [Aspergillus avenaceus]|uniref:Serine hydrolase FSH n=1 Tax=Aspergillus avenaceus TaxID=36643 RepID=A0A5N6TU21_ASPAV|nr:serine hydrolase FSH [Aspergillus avenaceus]
MRFLCLPGTFGTLIDELEKSGLASFYFTQGSFPSTPPPGFETYFGPPPHFRFMNFGEETVSALRSLSKICTREQAIQWLGTQVNSHEGLLSAKHAVADVLDEIDRLGIQGLIGYSEGAGIAASVLQEEQRRQAESGRIPRIKCAVFIGGWPPIDIRKTHYVFPTGDEDEDWITVPTCHVIGAEDVFLDGSKMLYEVCNADNSELFDHGGGHVIPRDPRTLNELVNVICNMIELSLKDS